MHVAFIIAGSLVAAGAILYIHHRLTDSKTPQPDGNDGTPTADDKDKCCGMHITCERDSLSPVFVAEPEYFDDEELDIYAGRDADNYEDNEIEQFRDILLTLRPEDIAPWARSIQQRGIQLPTAVRDELLMIVREARSRQSDAV